MIKSLSRISGLAIALLVASVSAFGQGHKMKNGGSRQQLEVTPLSSNAVKSISLPHSKAFHPKSSNKALVFSENFSAGVPATWTKVNVDGLQPNSGAPAIPAFQNVWDTGTAQGVRAVGSTSWLTSPVNANRWLISPQISIPAGAQYRISWDALAIDNNYRDGYEVYVDTTVTVAAPGSFAAGKKVFSIPANGFADGTVTPRISGENSTWTRRNVIVNPNYAGKSIRLAFRQNSKDMFIIYIANIKVESIDPYEMASSGSTFSGLSNVITPKDQFNGVSFSAEVSNIGFDTINAVSIKVDKFAGNGAYSDSSSSIDLLPGSAAVLNTANRFLNADTGVHAFAVAYRVSTANPLSNAIPNDTLAFLISDTVASNFLNLNSTVSAPGQFTAGSLFDVAKADTLTSVTFGIGAPPATNGYRVGDTLIAEIYSFDTANGGTFTLLRKSSNFYIPRTVAAAYTIGLKGGGLVLPAGQYLVAVKNANARSISLLLSDNYNPGTTFVRFGNNDFQALEDVAPINGNFLINANFGKWRQLENDLLIDSATVILTDAFTKPLNQLDSLSFRAKLTNLGSNTLTNAGFDVYSNFAATAVASGTVASLAPGASAWVVTTRKFKATTAGNETFQYVAKASVPLQDPNNVEATQNYFYSDSLYSVSDGAFGGTLNTFGTLLAQFSLSGPVSYGQVITLANDDTLTGIGVRLKSGRISSRLEGAIYDYNNGVVASTPIASLASGTSAYRLTAADTAGRVVYLKMAPVNGFRSIPLSAGQYVLMVKDQSNFNNIGVTYSITNVFDQGYSFFKANTAPWEDINNFFILPRNYNLFAYFGNPRDIRQNISKRLGTLEFKSYPNPAQNYVNIALNLKADAEVEVSILNAIGQSVRKVSVGELAAGDNTFKVNTAGIKPGIYFIQTKVGNNVGVNRLVIE